MENDNNLNLINSYFDGELSKEDEIDLFNILSKNTDAREYFNQMILLHSTMQATFETMPEYLEKKILNKVIGKNFFNNIYDFFLRLKFNFAYIIAVLLLVFSLYMLNQVSSLNNKVTEIQTKLINQNQTIEILYHSLPTTEVISKPDNEIIIKAKM